MGFLSVIRRWALRDKMPIREIARRTGLSRNTIKKYLREGAVEPNFKTPKRPSKLGPYADRLAEVFCLSDKRYVTKDLTLKYDRKRIRLEVNDLTRGLVGKYVDVYEMPDGRIQVRAKGVALPCSIFDPHQQRVTHAAITENKHLSAVLAHIKEEQEKAAQPPKVKPVSAKNGYKKTGRRPPGRPSKMEAYYERRRKERAKEAQEETSL